VPPALQTKENNKKQQYKTSILLLVLLKNRYTFAYAIEKVR
jgi:hypothetical protein